MNESVILRQFIWILPVLMLVSLIGIVQMGYSMAGYEGPTEKRLATKAVCPE